MNHQSEKPVNGHPIDYHFKPTDMLLDQNSDDELSVEKQLEFVASCTRCVLYMISREDLPMIYYLYSMVQLELQSNESFSSSLKPDSSE